MVGYCSTIYIRDSSAASAIKLDNDFPEQVWCKLRYNGHHELLVGVCYMTTTETVYGHIAHEQLRYLFQEVSNRDFILMGDFNYKGIDWLNNCCAGASEGIREWGDIASAGARAYNGGLGAEPPAGVQGQSSWSGGQGGEAPLKLTPF